MENYQTFWEVMLSLMLKDIDDQPNSITLKIKYYMVGCGTRCFQKERTNNDKDKSYFTELNNDKVTFFC